MGFRNNTYATVWSVEPKGDNITVVRISTSRKNKTTNEYERDFSGYVRFLGSGTARKAASLKERDRIRLLEVETCTRYDREQQKEFISYNVWSFEIPDEAGSGHNTSAPSPDEGEIEADDMPF